MFPKEFKPNALFKLNRVGRNNDGGYLICKNSILNSDTLISFGISDDFSFEENFQKIKNVNIFAFDPTVNSRFFLKQLLHSVIKIKFINFFLQLKNFVSFKKFFSRPNNKIFLKKIGKGGEAIYEYMAFDKILELDNIGKKLFFKIDIEGAEYRILNYLIKNSNRIEGLVIEFHNVDVNLELILNFIKEFKLKLIHIHGNNWSTYGENNIPSSIELSFAKDPIEIGKNVIFPHELDQKNNPNLKEIELLFSEK